MGNSKSSNKVNMANTPANDRPKNRNNSNKAVTMSELVNAPAPKTIEVQPVPENTSNAAAKAAGKMPVDLYYILPSNPCRAVMMLAKAIGLELNLKQCNILAGENRTPEYLKLNPQHTVPVMVDNGLIITESRAILSYFVNQYAKNDSLYPKDPKIRAMVDQSLYFDMGTLNARTQAYYNAVIFGAVQTPENLQKVHEAVGWLNTMLEGRQFAAGDQLTIADFALGVTVTNLDVFGFDINSYPNMIAWYARIKAAMAPYGYEEINQAGADMLAGMYRGKLAQS